MDVSVATSQDEVKRRDRPKLRDIMGPGLITGASDDAQPEAGQGVIEHQHIVLPAGHCAAATLRSVSLSAIAPPRCLPACGPSADPLGRVDVSSRGSSCRSVGGSIPPLGTTLKSNKFHANLPPKASRGRSAVPRRVEGWPGGRRTRRGRRGAHLQGDGRYCRQGDGRQAQADSRGSRADQRATVSLCMAGVARNDCVDRSVSTPNPQIRSGAYATPANRIPAMP
jgi:hypothetical protein